MPNASQRSSSSSKQRSQNPPKPTYDCVLLYSERCPKYQLAKELLNEAGLDCIEINITRLPLDHNMRVFGSPSLLCNSQLIFGSHLPGGISRPVEKITELELLRRIYGEDDT